MVKLKALHIALIDDSLDFLRAILCLVQLHGGMGKTECQQNQPEREQEQTIDGAVEEGHRTKKAVTIQPKNFSSKVQERQKGDKETNDVPARAESGIIDGTPPSYRDVDQKHKEKQNDPFAGIHECLCAGSNLVNNLNSAPSNIVVRV